MDIDASNLSSEISDDMALGDLYERVNRLEAENRHLRLRLKAALAVAGLGPVGERPHGRDAGSLAG